MIINVDELTAIISVMKRKQDESSEGNKTKLKNVSLRSPMVTPNTHLYVLFCR